MVAIGQLLDRRYLITQILGAGGFGQTYLAEDTKRPGSPHCVVKQLWLSHNSPQIQIARRLFEKEAEVLEKLGEHNQIPRLLAHFEEDQEFYLVEEYIVGHSLNAEIVPGRSLDEAQVLILLTQILEVLAFVHSHGVIHRDIKPANLIKRQQDQTIVLIDFGAVKEINTQLNQGQFKLTVAIGTPPYMPIEQLQGHPQYNSDIYAVGMIGIQALTGLSTDDLSKTQISTNSQKAEINWRKKAKVSSKLANVLAKMVHFDFKTRYQSVIEVLTDLKKINSGRLSLPPYKTALFTTKRRKHPNWMIRWSIRFGIGILILTAGLILAFLAFAPRELVAILTGGGKLIFFKDYQNAINDFNTAIATNPKYAEGYTLRGIARFNLGDYAGSIADYSKVLQLQPDNALIYNNRGIVHGLNREYKQAIADYNQALKLQPDYPEAYINRGNAHLNLKDYQAALKDYNQAIQMKPNLVQAYTNRGLVHEKLGEKTQAMQDYSQALRLNPQNVGALNNRGLLRTKQGDNRGAVEDFTQALKITPDNGQFYYGRAEAYIKLGDKKAAISDYQKAAKFCLDDGLTGCYSDANYRLKQQQ